MSNVNTPAVSWASLSGFGGSIENEATAFSDGVGGAYFEVGTHKDVVISVVEPKISATGNPYVKVTYESEDGAKISANLMLTPGKDGKGFHFTYTKFAAAAIGDAELRMRTFGKLFAQNPALLDSLRGLKVSITISKGKAGYVIEENALGSKVPVDVATGKEYPEFAGRVFADYSEIKDACKEYSIKRMYNEVSNVSKPSEEALAANEQALSEVLRSAEAPAAGKASTQSRAARPARTL